MNRLLQTRAEVSGCTEYIRKNGLIEHSFECKNWDIATICPHLKNGDLLDMGSNGSFLLPNSVKLGIVGRKCGIDLGNPEYDLEGIEYIKGNLMECPYEDSSFDTITNLSVVEHECSYTAVAKECGRLLRPRGELFITHDYWDPFVSNEGIQLYGLSWTILDRKLTEELIAACEAEGLKQTSPMDWTTNETVINDQFCAPYGRKYTFAILHFIKQ